MPRRGYRECPFCAEEIRENAKMCRFCGSMLSDADQAPQTISPVSLVSPTTGLEQQAAMESADPMAGHLRRLDQLTGTGEQYRNASIVFVDIAGYTAISGRLGAEYVKEILDVYYSICSQMVLQHNGFVLEFQGDGCLAAFGAPVAFGHDAESAVYAALAIRDRVMALPPMHGHKIRVSAGVETGKVLCSMIRSEQSPRYKLFGAAVNLASRIRDSAGPGQVVVGPITRQLTKKTFLLEARGARSFKNVDKPVETYEVGGILDDASRPYESNLPLFGRQHELSRLKMLWDQWANQSAGGRSACGVRVNGEAGIGKTRLLREFAETLGSNARLVYADSSPHETRIPLGTWRKVLLEFADCRATESSGTSWHALDEVLIDYGLAVEERWVLQAIANEPDCARRLGELPDENRRRMICSALRSFLLVASQTRHVLLVLDDIHWCDPTSLAVLESLSGSSLPGVFLALLSRQDHVFDQTRFNQLPRITLRELDVRSRRALIMHLAKTHDLGQTTRDAMLERSGGNPLYLIETMYATATDASSSAGASFVSETPETLTEVIQSRIDKLGAVYRAILQCCSVLGQQFSLELLCLCGFTPQDMVRRLHALKAWELLEDEVSKDGLLIRFRHHATREVAYDSLLERQRLEMHRTVAECVEAKYGANPGAYLPILAYHFGRCGDLARSVKYQVLAAEQAERLGAASEALSLCNEAHNNLRASDGSPHVLAHAADLLCIKGRLLILTGKVRNAAELLDDDLSKYSDSMTPAAAARVRFTLGCARLELGEIGAAETLFLDTLPEVERSGSTRTAAELHNALGKCAWVRGDLGAARTHYRAAANTGLKEHSPAIAGNALNNLALVEWRAGNLAEAQKLMRSALTWRRKSGDRFGTAVTVMNLGILEENRGHFAKAESLYGQALELAQQLGHRQVISASHANLANLYLAPGSMRADEALKHAILAAEVAKAIGDHRSEAISLENVALAHMALDQHDESARALKKARAVAQKTESRERIISLELVALELRLCSGRTSGIRRQLEKALVTVDDAGLFSERPRILRLLAQLELATGRRDLAQATARNAIEEARKQGAHTEETRVQQLMQAHQA